MEANPFTLRAFPPVSSTMSRGRGNLTLSPPLPAFSNPSVLWTPLLYFALQNTPQCCGTRQGGREILSSYLFFSPIRLTEDLYIALRPPMLRDTVGGKYHTNNAAPLPHSSKKGVGNATWNTAGERCRNVPFVKGKMESR